SVKGFPVSSFEYVRLSRADAPETRKLETGFLRSKILPVSSMRRGRREWKSERSFGVQVSRVPADPGTNTRNWKLETGVRMQSKKGGGLANITMKELLEAGGHFGHQTN